MMHNIKNIVLGLLALLITQMAWGKPVGPKEARQVAETFFHSQSLIDITAQVGCHNAYVFQPASGTGFVIVAGDDCANPILGFSFSEQALNHGVAPAVNYWLGNYSAQIAQARQDSYVSQKALAQWDKLRLGAPLSVAKSDSIGPLMTSTWDQSPRYNLMCPATPNGERSVTGCVATGLAQIMRYWRFPKHGYGAHSYTYENSSFVDNWPFGTVYARFDSLDYKWNKMPDKLNSNTPVNDVKATALLCSHVGIAVDMMYSPDGSGAWMMNEYVQWDNHPDLSVDAAAENRIPLYFGYKFSEVSLRSEYSDEVWENKLVNDIRTGHPILYAGWVVVENGTYFVHDSVAYTGHAFVLDGVTNVEGINYYHVNWGWGGGMNGWFPINALDPSTYTFDDLQGAFLGMEPDHSRLNMKEDFYVERHGRYWRATLNNTGDSAFRGLLAVQLTNETDTLWLQEPTAFSIPPTDNITIEQHPTPTNIPLGDYKAQILYGFTPIHMKPICDFEYSNSCNVYIDLDIESQQDVPFFVTSQKGQILVSNLPQGTGAVEVYDVMGRRIAVQYQPSTSVSFALPSQGIYIVRAGNYSQKIVLIK